MYTKEEVVEKVRVIAEGMDTKTEQAEQLKASVLMDRGRLEELKNLYNMILEAEAEVEAKKEEAAKKAAVKKGKK